MTYAVVGVSTGTFGRGVVMGISGGVGLVGGMELGWEGTSNGGVGMSDVLREGIYFGGLLLLLTSPYYRDGMNDR